MLNITVLVLPPTAEETHPFVIVLNGVGLGFWAVLGAAATYALRKDRS